ncbi:MAG: hypothetical protein GY838_01915 [bacterium]|nr:hypothetical protein [bacterium]
MPIHFCYHPARDLLIHVGQDMITLAEIDELAARRRAAGLPDSVAHTLNDMRHAHFDFSLDQLRMNQEGRPQDSYAGCRQAEIVTDPHNTAILLLWRNWLPAGIEVEVFSTPEAAYAWVGVERQDRDLVIRGTDGTA